MEPADTQPGSSGTAVAVPGFADHHAHLLRDAAGIALPVEPRTVAAAHRDAAAASRTPMDVPDPVPARPLSWLAGRLRAALTGAAAAGLTEITEMGVRDWRYLDALGRLQAAGPLPARLRIYLASGLADESPPAALAARRAASDGPWVRLEGVKFYADGWLGPRTCAVCRDFADTADAGLLFLDGPALARRITPLARSGWRIATHAIGDRAVAAVLDGYELAWDGDRSAMAAARPRVEHASLLSAELMARMAETGVTACVQPSFAVTDAAQLEPALGPARRALAYPWAALLAAGVAVVAGSDYPVEALDPLVGLARLVGGRSGRGGFATAGTAPAPSRLSPAAAFEIMTAPASGLTMLTADPRQATADEIDQIMVTGTAPAPFPQDERL